MALATTTFDWFRPAWQQRASCRGQLADGELNWFPEQGHSGQAAKAVCAGCPVRSECLDYARTLNITDGVWGGASPEERRAPRRRRRPRVRRRPLVQTQPLKVANVAKTECTHGHPFSEENTLYTKTGKRVCRACARERVRRRRAAMRKAA